MLRFVLGAVVVACTHARQLPATALVWSGNVSSIGGFAAGGPGETARYVGARTSPREVGELMEGAAASLLVLLPDGEHFGESPALADALAAAASSLVLPRVMPGCALQPTDFADRVEVVVWSELAARLATLKTRGVLAAVAPSAAALDEKVALLQSSVANRAATLGGSYVLCAVAPSDAAAREPTAVRRRLEHRRLSSSGSAPIGIRMTPDILTGVLVGLLFAFVIILGTSCIGAIQTPSKFSFVGPPSMKEF